MTKKSKKVIYFHWTRKSSNSQKPSLPDDLLNRLQDVNLNDTELLWSKLSEAEKQEFQSMVLNGEVEKIFTPIKPWWEESVETLKESPEIENKLRKTHKEIKSFAEITKKEPSFNVNYNLCNIVGAYTVVYRYFNGDLEEYIGEAAGLLHSTCHTLSKNTVFDSITSALQSIVKQCTLHSLEQSEEQLREDLNRILEESELHDHIKLIVVLGDVKRIFKTHSYSSKTKSTISDTPDSFSKTFAIQIDDDGKTFKLHCRKIDYYLSYVKDKFNFSVLALK